MLVSGVVDHIVHVDADVVRVRLGDQALEIGLRLGGRMRSGAIGGIQGRIVRDVIPVVGLGHLRRGEPEGGDAQLVQVIQVVLDALEVADAVAVGIGETVHIDLVDDTGGLLGR